MRGMEKSVSIIMLLCLAVNYIRINNRKHNGRGIMLKEEFIGRLYEMGVSFSTGDMRALAGYDLIYFSKLPFICLLAYL